MLLRMKAETTLLSKVASRSSLLACFASPKLTSGCVKRGLEMCGVGDSLLQWRRVTSSLRGVLCAYARARPCPVLTEAVYALQTWAVHRRCPVLTKAMLFPSLAWALCVLCVCSGLTSSLRVGSSRGRHKVVVVLTHDWTVSPISLRTCSYQPMHLLPSAYARSTISLCACYTIIVNPRSYQTLYVLCHHPIPVIQFAYICAMLSAHARVKLSVASTSTEITWALVKR
eukprot:1579861-Rhodomonas_salina.2